MAQVYSIRKICELALQKIGAVTEFDTGASAYQMQVAQNWLDMIVSNLSATVRNLWLIEETVFFDIPEEDVSFNLMDELGASAPADGILFPIRVVFRQAGIDTPGSIFNRGEYDAIDDKTEPGTPTGVYIDRLDEPTCYMVPPAIADGGWQMGLTFARSTFDQSHSPAESRAVDLPKTFNLWAVTELARQLADGPIINKPDNELNRWGRESEKVLTDLLAYANHEHADEPRRTIYVDF